MPEIDLSIRNRLHHPIESIRVARIGLFLMAAGIAGETEAIGNIPTTHFGMALQIGIGILSAKTVRSGLGRGLYQLDLADRLYNSIEAVGYDTRAASTTLGAPCSEHTAQVVYGNHGFGDEYKELRSAHHDSRAERNCQQPPTPEI